MLAPNAGQGEAAMPVATTRVIAALALLLTLCAAPVRAQVSIAEDFNPSDTEPTCATLPFDSFAPGWLLRNVDNRTPATNVAYVTRAWIVREDFRDDPTNCAAFSTSWYNPVGAANDFMCTPQLTLGSNPLLTWRAVAYDPQVRDGYEVRVMRTAPTGGTGAQGNLLTSSTLVTTVAAENATWTSRQASLAPLGFANETAWVCFRNNSNDMFLLAIDDVVVRNFGPDAELRDPATGSQFSKVPSWGNFPVAPAAAVAAAGGTAISNVLVSVASRVNGADRWLWQSGEIASIAAGASATPVFDSSAPMNEPGTWTTRYVAFISESDVYAGNNAAVSAQVEAGSEELTRVVEGTFQATGVSANGGGELGSLYDLVVRTQLRAVKYTLFATPAPGWVGKNVVANLRAWDGANGRPGAIIASTVPHVATAALADVTATFVGGPVLLNPGRYVVTIAEPLGQPMPLATTDRIFTANTTWAFVPGMAGGWGVVPENAPRYSRVPRFTLLMDPPPIGLFANGFENPPPALLVTEPAVTAESWQPAVRARGEPVVLESVVRGALRR